MAIKLEEDTEKLYNCMECHKRVIPKKEGAVWIVISKTEGKIRLCKKCFEERNKKFTKIN